MKTAAESAKGSRNGTRAASNCGPQGMDIGIPLEKPPPAKAETGDPD